MSVCVCCACCFVTPVTVTRFHLYLLLSKLLGAPVLDLSTSGDSDQLLFDFRAKSASAVTNNSRKRPANVSSENVPHEGGPLKTRRLPVCLYLPSPEL